MIRFAHVDDARVVRSPLYRVLGVAYGALLVLCATAQLFFFEDFVSALTSDSTEMLASTIAVSIVAIEIFSLPFLLRLRASRLFRYMSASFSVAVPIIWMLNSFLVDNLSIVVKIYPGAMVQGFAMICLTVIASAIVYGYARK